MADIKQAYAAASAVTITLASLATDANLLTGRESTLIDNSSNLYLDYLLAGLITTGTSPVANSTIRVFVIGMRNDTIWPEGFDGSDSAETIGGASQRESYARLAASFTVTSISNVGYPFGPVSVASLFGGVLPRKFVIFVTHDTGVNLNSTAGNHVINVTPCYNTVV